MEEEFKERTQNFMNWCQDNGVLMPKLEYPAVFEGGLIGVKCKEDISH